MTDTILFSYWSADESVYSERVKHALNNIDSLYGSSVYWKALPTHPISPDDRFVVEKNEIETKCHGKLSELWEKTLDYSSEPRWKANRVIVNSSVYSDDMKFGVRIYFDCFKLVVETESEFTKHALNENLEFFMDLMIKIGSSPMIGACWMRGQCYFAGDPVYLYEPKHPFKKLHDALDYEEVIEEAQETRKIIRSSLAINEFKKILTDLEIEFEDLTNDRLFIKLGFPVVEDGKKNLRKLEKEIKCRLKL